MTPAVVLGAPDLSIDEPIDRLIADDLPLVFFVQSTRHLGRRPALAQPSENPVLKIGIAQQSTAFPAPALGLLLCVGRLVAHLSAAVAFELTHYSRWRAIHSCRDLADCFPGLAKSGNRTALFKRKLFIASSHRNTLSKKCCTSFVNLGNPGLVGAAISLDTGLRGYDGTRDLIDAGDHRCTCIFEGGHEGHEVRSLNHPKPSCYHPYYLRGLGKLPDAPKPRGRVSNPPLRLPILFCALCVLCGHSSFRLRGTTNSFTAVLALQLSILLQAQ